MTPQPVQEQSKPLISSQLAPTPQVLSQPELKLQFGRLNATRRRIAVTVDPGLLTRVWQKEYRVLTTCLGGLIAPSISEDEYIRMSRTLLLKRLQDIQEYQTGIRPDGTIRMARGLEIPQPSAELLYALGPYFCDVNGRQYFTTYPPTPTQTPPNWYTLDPTILGNYRLLMDQVRSRYRTVLFPKSSECIGQPLMFTVGKEENGMKTVRASINVPTPADGFLRFVHEEFYTNGVPNFNTCDLIMTETLFIDDVVDKYVRSYVISVHG